MTFLKKFSFTALALAFSFSAYASPAQVQSNLKQKHPDLPFQTVNSTPMPSIYEVQLDDGSLVYTDIQADYFLLGNLIDFKKQINLTEQRTQQLNQVDVKKLPLDQAIKQVKGTGKHTLYIFTDPDCPYCKMLEKELAKMDNLTIYTFLYPIKDVQAQTKKAEKIWCSSNPADAWQKLMLDNVQPTGKANCSNPINKNLQLGQQLKVFGTPTLFLENGERIPGALKAEQLQQILNAQ